MLQNNNLIIGYSGHAFVVLDSFLSSGGEVQYYSEMHKKDFNPFDLFYLGNESDSKFSGWEMDLEFILGIGNNMLREKIGLNIKSKNKKIINVIHPNSLISNKVDLGNGVFISKGAMINPLSIVNDFAILNSGCIIEHESEIGQATHIAPGTVIAGNVKIGNRTFVGANSVVKEGITIGDDVIIGAGSVIIKDVPSGSKVVGNPGKII